MDTMQGGIATFSELFNLYMSHHARLHCKRWRDYERMYNCYLKQWADLPCDQIKRFRVQMLHTELGERVGRTTANRVVQLLRAVFNRGRAWEVVTNNPATGIRLFRLRSRERFLSEEELTEFFKALQTLRYDTTRDFVMMCLLTGARRSNVASMRWDELDLTRGIWYIPDTKNGTSHVLPLVGMSLDILRKRLEQRQSVWVFPSERSRSGHLTKPEKAWKMLVARANLTDLRIHDLRRTLASYQAMTGSNLSIIAKTLNHKDLKSVAVYARLQIDPVRESMETAVAVMARQKIIEG